MLSILKKFRIIISFVAGIFTSIAIIVSNIPNYIPFSDPIVTISEQNQIPISNSSTTTNTWAITYEIRNYGGKPLRLNGIIMKAIPRIKHKRIHNVQFNMYDMDEKTDIPQGVIIAPGEKKAISISLKNDIPRSTKALLNDKIYYCLISFVYANKIVNGDNASDKCDPDKIYDMLNHA